jgi:hypothetical protein
MRGGGRWLSQESLVMTDYNSDWESDSLVTSHES